jgi:hypothetical protein
MKTCLIYGLAVALAGIVLNLILFFLGFHSDAARFGTGQAIGGIGAIAIAIVGILLGTRARRAEVPASEPFGYGRAFGAGFMIALFAALFSIVTTYIYFHLINPGIQEVIAQAQIDKWEAAGMSSDRIESAEAVMRKMMHPAIQAAFGFIAGVISGTVIALITSAFCRREVTDPQPPALA